MGDISNDDLLSRIYKETSGDDLHLTKNCMKNMKSIVDSWRKGN